MRVLICADTSNFWGETPLSGMTTRQMRLNQELTSAAHDKNDVRFLIEDSGVPVPSWANWPFDSWVVRSDTIYGDVLALADILREFAPEIIVAKSPHDLVRFGRSLADELGARLIYEIHDDEARSLASLGRSAREVMEAGRLQQTAARLADGVVVFTDEERQTAIGWVDNPERVQVIPMGADVHVSTRTQSESLRLLFIGNLFHEPNELALDFLVREVLPPLRSAGESVQLKVVGRVPVHIQTRHSSEIDFKGPVVPLSAAFTNVDIGVCPVTTGAGMKTKVVDMMGAALPIVCSEYSTAGFSADARRALEIVTDEKEFAQRVLRLWRNKTRMRTLADAALAALKSELAWEGLGAVADGTYRRMMALEPSSRRMSPRTLAAANSTAANGTMWQESLRTGKVWPYPHMVAAGHYVRVIPEDRGGLPVLSPHLLSELIADRVSHAPSMPQTSST